MTPRLIRLISVATVLALFGAVPAAAPAAARTLTAKKAKKVTKRFALRHARSSGRVSGVRCRRGGKLRVTCSFSLNLANGRVCTGGRLRVWYVSRRSRTLQTRYLRHVTCFNPDVGIGDDDVPSSGELRRAIEQVHHCRQIPAPADCPQPPAPANADDNAKEKARRAARAALEYGNRKGEEWGMGSPTFAGISNDAVLSIDAGINDLPDEWTVSTPLGATSAYVSVDSIATGTEFQVIIGPDGTMEYECFKRGTGGGCAGGSWT